MVLVVIIYQTVKRRHLKTASKTIKTSITTLIDSSVDSDLSSSTNYFNSFDTSNKSFRDLNVSTRSRKSLRRSPITPRKRFNTSANFLFGSKAVLENPLLKSHNSDYSKHSFKKLDNNVEDDLESAIMNLSLGRSYSRPTYRPTNVFRSRPIVSPPSFIYNSKCTSSWSTNNWLQQVEPRFSSRSSSQTSGFVSLPPNELNTSQNSFSLPDSASSSICGDLDRTSVVSEPISPALDTSFSSSKLGMDLNHSTASKLRSLMKSNNGRMNGSSIGLFKPIVFKSDDFDVNS